MNAVVQAMARRAAPRGARASGERALRVAPAMAAAVAAALGFTLLVSVTGVVSFAYRSPSLHVADETVAFLASAVAAQTVYGRFRSSQELRDLLLTASLCLFAAVNLAFSAVPAILSGDPGPFETWAPVLGQLAATVVLAVAAFAPDRVLHRPRVAATRTFVAVLGVLAAIAAGALALGPLLPRAVPPTFTPSGPRVVGDPVVLAVQLGCAALFAAAAARFAVRAARTGDAFLLWLAIGATWGAFARVNYFLFPSLYTPWFYAGDVLRLASVLALFAAGVQEMRRLHQALAAAAVVEERGRIARELHDGVTQDLAFILQQLRHMAGRPGASSSLATLVAAAEGALDESRHAIGALNRPAGGPLDEAVATVAREAAEREGSVVELDLASDVTVPGTTLQEVLRVVREAVVNAVRHGDAKRIRVQLREHPQLCIRIVDDGRGFDPQAAPRAGRLGLEGMRARIEAIGGELRIASRPGGGTEVRVTLP